MLIEDAIWHASPADVAGLRPHITAMEDDVAGADPVAFIIEHRHELHRDLVDALDQRDRDTALRLIHEHNTTPASEDFAP